MNIFLNHQFKHKFCVLSYRDGSFEYPKHMFWLRNKKNNFLYALLTKGLAYWLDQVGGLSSSYNRQFLPPLMSHIEATPAPLIFTIRVHISLDMHLHVSSNFRVELGYF